MRIKITKTVTVFATETGNLHFPAGWQGTVKHDHAERIVAAGAGEIISEPKKPETAPEAKK